MKHTPRTRTKLITYNGKTQSLAEWADEYGLRRGNLYLRLRAGWDFEKAITTPPSEHPWKTEHETCTIEGCEKKHFAHGLCSQHYQKQRYIWQKQNGFVSKAPNRDHHINLFYSTKARAKKYGIPFNLDPEDFVFPNTCPALGIPIRPSKGLRTVDNLHDNSPSVDRIDPKGGYVKGNIRMISNRANTLKNNATLDEMRKVIRYMEESLPQEPSL